MKTVAPSARKQIESKLRKRDEKREMAEKHGLNAEKECQKLLAQLRERGIDPNSL